MHPAAGLPRKEEEVKDVAIESYSESKKQDRFLKIS